MIVKTLSLNIYIDNSRSLKDKRSILQSIIQRCRQKFNVSISEVDNLDETKMATIGIAIISNSVAYADEVLDKCLNLIEQDYDIEVIALKREQR